MVEILPDSVFNISFSLYVFSQEKEEPRNFESKGFVSVG